MLFQSLCGKPIDIAKASQQLGNNKVSLADLRKTLLSGGVPCSIKRCSPLELLKLPPPFIIYREGETANQGAFAVLLRYSTEAQSITVCNTGPLTFEELTIDEFSRSWSGYFIARNVSFEDRLSTIRFPLITLVTFIAWRLGYIIFRSKKPASQVLTTTIAPGKTK